MGSNLVQLTDRIYMRRLHERILEDYVQVMEKRIADREVSQKLFTHFIILNTNADFYLFFVTLFFFLLSANVKNGLTIYNYYLIATRI